MGKEIFCSYCKRSMVISAAQSGASVQCPSCKMPISVPASPAANNLPSSDSSASHASRQWFYTAVAIGILGIALLLGCVVTVACWLALGGQRTADSRSMVALAHAGKEAEVNEVGKAIAGEALVGDQPTLGKVPTAETPKAERGKESAVAPADKSQAAERGTGDDVDVADLIKKADPKRALPEVKPIKPANDGKGSAQAPGEKIGLVKRLSEEQIADRVRKAGGKIGKVTVSLAWENYNDLDLHIVTANGERIFYGNRRSSCGGQLDIDQNVAPTTMTPVENIYWPEGSPPRGPIKIYVDHYCNHGRPGCKDPTRFVVRVQIDDKVQVFEGAVSHIGNRLAFVAEIGVKPSIGQRKRR